MDFAQLVVVVYLYQVLTSNHILLDKNFEKYQKQESYNEANDKPKKTRENSRR